MHDATPDIPKGETRVAPRRPAGNQLTPSEFERLFVQSSPQLWSIAAAILTNRAAADDCLQDAAAIALTKLGEFDPDSSFPAWMGQIVRFVSLNEFRKRARAKATPTDPEHLTSAIAPQEAEPQPLDHTGRAGTDQSAFDDATQRALRALDETARICLLLRTLHHMPYDQISRLLGIPEGTAMSHVHRSRASLRQSLAAGGAA